MLPLALGALFALGVLLASLPAAAAEPLKGGVSTSQYPPLDGAQQILAAARGRCYQYDRNSVICQNGPPPTVTDGGGGATPFQIEVADKWNAWNQALASAIGDELQKHTQSFRSRFGGANFPLKVHAAEGRDLFEERVVQQRSQRAGADLRRRPHGPLLTEAQAGSARSASKGTSDALLALAAAQSTKERP